MLKVFEAFSGVGAQRMALNNIGMKYEVVATSEIDENAILAYFSAHINQINQKNIIEENKEEIINILSQKLSNNKFKNKNLNYNDIKKIYIADKSIKNLGDIKKVELEDIPDHDIFTYSFPCQDISSVGTRKGLDDGSGTRSSLLWECKKIIENKKPKYLLMENVKNLTTGKNRNNFLKWLEFLEKEGYENHWKIFDSQFYGIPQRRPRVIVVSKLGGSKINLVKDNKFKSKSINDILDESDNSWIEFVPKSEVKGEIYDSDILFLDDRDWKMNGVMINKVCSTQRAGRTGLKFIKKENGILYERKLNALECCRLMGFNDKTYYSMKKIGLSNTAIMKICGNSIVVPVLEVVFRNIYEEENLYD